MREFFLITESFSFRPSEYEVPIEVGGEVGDENQSPAINEVALDEPQPTSASLPLQQPQQKVYEPFAQCVDPRNPKGWLVDLLNRFGHYGGFDRLLERFCDTSGLTVPVIHALVRPFGQCHALLTSKTLNTYLLPIVEGVPTYLESLSDDELKKEVKTESKNDSLSAIVKSLKCIASSLPGQEETVRQLEMFRLKMILRQLRISSFGGKMSALNEVNRVNSFNNSIIFSDL
jgi:ubiquitin carboxyl-terminal hydrolase 9/24